jgi:UDP-N-acetylmuramoyl-L-alanyl-D-glutamate--2,6-diaminopimelate ligase
MRLEKKHSKFLSQLLSRLQYRRIKNYKDVIIRGITCDSRQTGRDYIFVAICGNRFDGSIFADQAVKKGCISVVAEHELSLSRSVPQIIVENPRRALAELSTEFYDRPSERIKIIGVTGTCGKTTTASLTRSILQGAGYKVGLLGTVCYELPGRSIINPMTTPPAHELQHYLSELADAGYTYAVMEVSSHALVQYRVHGVRFASAILTNISQDHFDYHHTFENYRAAKGILFQNLAPDSVAILNADDPASRFFSSLTRARVLSYGMRNEAQATGTVFKANLSGTEGYLVLGGKRAPFKTSLIGHYNIYNILAASCCAQAMGVDLETILCGIEDFKGVKGRLEAVDCGQEFKVFVDYAHTEEALRNVLMALRPMVDGRIILVFGCGGDRDRDKRPKMGRVAQRYSDIFILTSDNPRSEDPIQIIREIEAGVNGKGSYTVEPDRYKAIAQAISLARKDDLVLIAGKGHETSQILKEARIYFDDRQVARDLIAHLLPVCR